MRCAQSSGEWPGGKRTFLEGREEGGRVEIEAGDNLVFGEREDVAGERRGGPR